MIDFGRRIFRLAMICTIGLLWSCHSPDSVSSLESLIVHTENKLSNVQTGDENYPSSFGWGREATLLEIDSLSITVFPDGIGLPDGEGTPPLGKTIYQQKCAACHGLTGKEGPEDILVFDAKENRSNKRTPKTVGNYWPYPTTLFDYIKRAMPTNAPGSLTDEEVYNLTAWLLFANGIISENVKLNASNLHLIQLPNQSNFKPDDRVTGPNPIY